MDQRPADQLTLERVVAVMRTIEIGMLTTTGADGRLHSRPMAAGGNIDDDGRIWLFTVGASGKVAEFERQPAVNVAFADPVRQIYVSIAGTSRLVSDRTVLAQRWRPALARWFPKGLDEADMALIEVTPQDAEYWDAPSRMTTLLFGTRATTAHGAVHL